jgi:hypothetical protein
MDYRGLSTGSENAIRFTKQAYGVLNMQDVE